MKCINEIVFSGKDIYVFIKDMTTHMRNLLMAKVSENVEEILDMSSENISYFKGASSKNKSRRNNEEYKNTSRCRRTS